MKNLKKKRWSVIISIAVILAFIFTAFPIHIGIGDAENAVLRVGKEGGFYLTIGNPTMAADADYTCDGTADDDTFQTAIDALPASGGQLFVLAGTYNWAAGETVTRAIDDVSIVGVGGSVYFDSADESNIFSAGGDRWLFCNLRTDAGSLDMGATSDWMWLNVMAARTWTTSTLVPSGKGDGRWGPACTGRGGDTGSLDHASIQAATPWRSRTTSPSRLDGAWRSTV